MVFSSSLVTSGPSILFYVFSVLIDGIVCLVLTGIGFLIVLMGGFASDAGSPEALRAANRMIHGGFSLSGLGPVLYVGIRIWLASHCLLFVLLFLLPLMLLILFTFLMISLRSSLRWLIGLPVGYALIILLYPLLVSFRN